MNITDKDTADDVKYHLMRENPPELHVIIDEIDKADPETLSELCKVMEHGKDSLKILKISTPTKASECRDFFTLTNGSRICKFNEGHPHRLCENMVKYGECPKGIKEV
jgi:hypothetical protein